MNAPESASPAPRDGHRPPPDAPFVLLLGIVGGTYVVLLAGMLLADVSFLFAADTRDVELPQTLDGPVARRLLQPVLPVLGALRKPEIRYSIRLSLVSCFLTAVLSVATAVPLGYLLSRWRFPGRNLLDALLDVPIVLPPLVIGLSLLILFQYPPFRWYADDFVFKVPGVVLAQYMVAAAFAVRTMRVTFDQIDSRRHDVALTLGCSRMQAFGYVVLPEAWHGIVTAGTLAWARALGEFGPLLIFAGATRNKTEVLSTTVFLELSLGDIEAAVAVSMIMVLAAVAVLVVTRMWGLRESQRRT